MLNFFKALFFSPEELRLRAGWRLLIHFCIALLLTVILLRILKNESPEAGIITQGIAIIASIYIARRFLDKRTFTSLGLHPNPSTLKDILAGIAISGVMMGIIYLIQFAAGWLTPLPSSWSAESPENVLAGLLSSAMVFTAVGFYEEILSRGYQLQNIEEGLNTFWAVSISSSIFGIFHIPNPNATWISTVGILAAGIFLAYGYLSTRQLWLPIGLHIGWNFFEGPIFGFPVSGLNTYQLLKNKITGPELITGGAFGPEAGLILLPGLALGAYLIYLYTKDRLEIR